MRNPTAPKHVDPEQIEKVNKTLGKNGQMQECYWRRPDKNITGETTMQTTCSKEAEMGPADNNVWKIWIFSEKSGRKVRAKRNLRDSDVLKCQQSSEDHEGKQLWEHGVEKLWQLWRTSPVTEHFQKKRNSPDLLAHLEHLCPKSVLWHSAALAALLQLRSGGKPQLLISLCERNCFSSSFNLVQHNPCSVPCSGSETRAMTQITNSRVKSESHSIKTEWSDSC